MNISSVVILMTLACASLSRADIHLQPRVENVTNVDEALHSKDFGQRLEAFNQIDARDRSEFKRVALKMLKDPALLIRLAAVRKLQKFSEELSVRRAFWEAFESSNNVKHGRPLLAKLRIFEVLARSPEKSELKKFALHKNDSQLGAFATKAIAKLSSSPVLSGSETLKSLVR